MRASRYRERCLIELIYLFIYLQDESPNEATKYLFDRLPYSLFTTFMLILGEMKYPHTVFKYQPLPYPGISYVVYVIFCVCMPIIIKNLLVSTNVWRNPHSVQSAGLVLQVVGTYFRRFRWREAFRSIITALAWNASQLKVFPLL